MGDVNTTVFLGPSLPSDEAATLLPSADLRGPATLGDIHDAVIGGSTAVCLIDGLFERVPAVWHKEVLWALEKDVVVVGASSMGALRAAELAPFGMVGIGSVYEDVLAGRIEDDDDVAVAHLAAEMGYRPTSDAMVDIRATVDRAVVDGVVDREWGATLVEAAKRRFYADRTIVGAVRDLEGSTDPAVPTAFLHWLPTGRVNRKAEDAREALAWIAEPRRPAERKWRMEPTSLWDQALAGLSDRSGAVDDRMGRLHEVLDSNPDERRQLTDAALIRYLSLALGGHRGIEFDQEQLQLEFDALRARHGLDTPTSVRAWMARNDLDDRGLRVLLRTEAHVRWVGSLAHGHLGAIALDVLRNEGRYGELT